MKLVFIYGPPASGKLTVAEKLSKLTGIRLFHNHLTRDLVRGIYGDAIEANYGLVDKLRTDVFEYCAKNGTDLIFTFVYGGLGDEEESVVQSYVKAVEANGGKVEFVELTTQDEDLLKRVNNESRRKHQKLLDPEGIRSFLQMRGEVSISFANAYKIDTSNTQPEEAARLIAAEFGLKPS